MTESPYQLCFPYVLQPGGSWNTGWWKAADCCGRFECLRQEMAHWVCSSVSYPARTISNACPLGVCCCICTSVYPMMQRPKMDQNGCLQRIVGGSKRCLPQMCLFLCHSSNLLICREFLHISPSDIEIPDSKYSQLGAFLDLQSGRFQEIIFGWGGVLRAFNFRLTYLTHFHICSQHSTLGANHNLPFDVVGALLSSQSFL